MEGEPDLDPEYYDLMNNLSELCSKVSEFRNTEDFEILKSSKTYAPLHVAYCMDKEKQQNVTSVVRTDHNDYVLKDLLREIKFVSKLEHSNVLKFYENSISLDRNQIGFIYEGHACFLSEVLDADVQIVYRPEVIKHIMKELFTALDYLHKNRVVHRDIQPENIALTYSGTVKVWNFRHAQTVDETLVELKANHFRYQSVESILQEGTARPSLDVWSANVIFGELWLKTFLFPTAGKEYMLTSIFSLLGFPTKTNWKSFYRFREAENLLVYSSYVFNLLEAKFALEIELSIISPQGWHLLQKNFRYFPRKRLSAEKCLAHRYFSEEPMACGSDILGTIARLTEIHHAKNSIMLEIATWKSIARM